MIDLQQIPPDALSDLGLVHKYPLHIDLVNNETGFALYVETPVTTIADEGWLPLFGLEEEGWVKDIHVDDYIPGMAPENETDNWYHDLMLRIREVDEDGTHGYWRTMELSTLDFSKNTNPPDALDDLGFDDFDSVTWLEGLEPGKNYQVQVWFEVDGYAGINAQGHYVRKSWRVYEDSEDEVGELVYDDHYRWQEADVYSGIHHPQYRRPGLQPRY